MVLKIKYGTRDNNIDVTKLALEKCMNGNVLFIPRGDHDRACLFSDPLEGVVKSIFVQKYNSLEEYDSLTEVFIQMNEQIDLPPHSRLEIIHSRLHISAGSFNDEVPEQLMVSKYIYGTEKVLEIGGNIGRNSLIIGYLLNEQRNTNFVCLECDSDICNQLIYNRNINNLNFHVEASALSKRKLIQKGWDTICSDVLLEGYKPVNTITLDELNAKYNIHFDTLVLDCEGAFYYILQDMPEILNNINLIIMENDYYNYNHKLYVDNVLRNRGFYVDHSEAGGWGPCQSHFFEVWKR